MRTTLTLEDDVAIRLEKLRKERDESLKSVVNEVLRRGLEAIEKPTGDQRPYRITPHDGGRCFLPSLDNLHEALAFGEGEAFR